MCRLFRVVDDCDEWVLATRMDSVFNVTGQLHHGCAALVLVQSNFKCKSRVMSVVGSTNKTQSD